MGSNGDKGESWTAGNMSSQVDMAHLVRCKALQQGAQQRDARSVLGIVRWQVPEAENTVQEGLIWPWCLGSADGWFRPGGCLLIAGRTTGAFTGASRHVVLSGRAAVVMAKQSAGLQLRQAEPSY